MFLLTPAKNRDYTTEEEVQKAFDENEIFLMHGPNGQEYCCKIELQRDFGRGWYVSVIYAKGSCVVRLEI